MYHTETSRVLGMFCAVHSSDPVLHSKMVMEDVGRRQNISLNDGFGCSNMHRDWLVDSNK